jgi:hypothetical protein
VRRLSENDTRQRAALARDLAHKRGVPVEDAADVVDAIESQVRAVQRMFYWTRADTSKLRAEAWRIVLDKWAKWDVTQGPPAPYFRMVLAHALKHSVRADDPRRIWTKGKNKPKRIGSKVAIVARSDGDDAPGGVVEDALPIRHEPLDALIADDGALIRMHAALLAACGGDQDEYDRILNAERATDPDGVELRARRRKELKAIVAFGRQLGLEDT